MKERSVSEKELRRNKKTMIAALFSRGQQSPRRVQEGCTKEGKPNSRNAEKMTEN